MLAVPGGIEKYFEELRELMAAEPSWPPEGMEPVLAIMRRYDTFPPPVSDAP